MDVEKSRIERLKRALYSRDESRVPKEHRTPVHGEETGAPHDWGEHPSFDISYEAMAAKKHNSFFDNFLGISIVFFTLSLAVAVFIFFGGLNIISSNNVDIKITGPSSVSSGEELDAELSIVNGNRTDLQNAVLYITYPDGARGVGAESVPLTRDKIDLGTIAAGKSADYSLRTLLFGEVDTVRSISLRLEYTIKGSDATFSKDKIYDVSINSSPIILNLDYPKEINSGQEFVMTLDVTSNSSVNIPDTLVKIEYPYGFTFGSSSIKPVRDGLWDIGDLKDGDKKSLWIKGTLVGQNLEERTFRVSVGTAATDSSHDFGTVLSASDATVALSKSFFDLRATSGGRNAALASVGDHIPVDISWQNTLPDKIVNAKISVIVSGNVFDRSSISASNGGFYRSLDNTILWDKNGNANLSTISPGDSGHVSFSVSPISDVVQVRAIKNPHIDITATMSGDRLTQDTTPVSSDATITIRLKSTVGLSSRSYRNIAGFTNTGPIPPRADTESLYTIVWVITNTTNDLSGATVSATLPDGVRWVGNTAPSSEDISFNPDNKQVVWNVGPVAFGSGYTYSPRKVSFQVGLTPSVTDVGSPLNLVSATQGSAFDTYASTTLFASAPAASTRYADPTFNVGDDIVVK